MLYLCLAILSSAAIALLMRISSGKVSAKLSMLGVNYIVCALLGALYCNFDLFCPTVPGFAPMTVMGVISGFLYLGGFVLCQWNSQHNGIVMTSVFMKLGLLVPMALSVLLFRELPSPVQIIGFCLALAAILLINLKKDTGANRFRWQLVAMLLLCGSSEAMAKVFEVVGTPSLANQYLFYTFAVALALCALLVICKKERPGIPELLFGIAIGVPNFFSAKFLLLSLKDLPAVVVFPSFSITTMLIATLAGVLLFKERLQKLQWVAMAGIILALFLLNI